MALAQVDLAKLLLDKVHVADAADLFATLGASTVALVVLDPPGNLAVAERSYDPTQPTPNPLTSLTSHYTGLAEDSYRVLRPGAATVFIGDHRQCAAWEIAAGTAGLLPGASMVVLWETPPKAANKCLTPFASSSTYIRWHVRPGHRAVARRRTVSVQSNVIVCRQAPSPSRPVELMNYLLTLFTDRGDTVVDPFCRGGSTVISAIDCDRHWIAADSDPEQVRVVQRRVAQFAEDGEDWNPLYLWTPRRLISVKA